MKRKQYYYNGSYYTGAALARLGGLSKDVVYERLKNGWPVEYVVETPSEKAVMVEEKWLGKTLEVKFLKHIPAVFADMQPTLGKVYVAVPGGHVKKYTGKHKQHFLITLDNGKPLVVYPDEFEVIRAVEG